MDVRSVRWTGNGSKVGKYCRDSVGRWKLGTKFSSSASVERKLFAVTLRSFLQQAMSTYRSMVFYSIGL